MKSLSQFINENKNNLKKYNVDPDNISLESFMKDNYINEDNTEALNWYAENICDKDGFYKYFKYNSMFREIKHPFNQINEMLKSSSFSLFIKEINKILGSDNQYHTFEFTDEYEFKQDEDTVNSIYIPVKLYDKDKIESVCDKMMWQFNAIRTKDGIFANPNNDDINPKKFSYTGIDCYLVRFEPIQSQNVTDFVKKNCNGIVYHLCKKDDLEKIMKSGLRMKGEKNSYRFIKNKVYLICGESIDELKRNIRAVAASKYYWDWTNKTLKDKVCLLKIDCSKYNIDFYKDTYYEDGEYLEYIMYSYAYFPSKIIEEIKFEQLTEND